MAAGSFNEGAPTFASSAITPLPSTSFTRPEQVASAAAAAKHKAKTSPHGLSVESC